LRSYHSLSTGTERHVGLLIKTISLTAHVLQCFFFNSAHPQVLIIFQMSEKKTFHNSQELK